MERDNPPSPSTETQCSQAAFMQLPVDLILLLSNAFLTPASALSLSLTCKNMFHLLFTAALPRISDTRTEKETFLLLMEKDAGYQRSWYYCHSCVRLHSFDINQEGPTTFDYGGALGYSDCQRNRLCLDGSEFTIGYHHARLAMNQHFYGAWSGLPLSKFDISYQTPPHIQPCWGQKWSAKVIDDKFFLSATHSISFPGTEAAFRDILDLEEYKICAHVQTTKNTDARTRKRDELTFMFRQRVVEVQNRSAQYASTYYKIDAPMAQRVRFIPSWGPDRTINAFRLEGNADRPQENRSLSQCRDVPGACIFCATDYVTTLEKGRGRGMWSLGREEWTLSIVTYHQLGSCRSPTDPKWQAFGGQVWNQSNPERELFGPIPGGVKRKWNGAA